MGSSSTTQQAVETGSAGSACRYRLQNCNWGCIQITLFNDLYAAGCKIRQNKQRSAAGSFINHTGGGVYIPYGHADLRWGGTYEEIRSPSILILVSTGSALLRRSSTIFLIHGIYTEGLYDCLASILGSNNVTIQNVHTTGAAKKIYVQNVRGVKQHNNDQAYFVVAPNCRDLETDTPELTRFTSATTGTTTMTIKVSGFIQSRQDDGSPDRSAHQANITDGPRQQYYLLLLLP